MSVNLIIKITCFTEDNERMSAIVLKGVEVQGEGGKEGEGMGGLSVDFPALHFPICLSCFHSIISLLHF